MSFVIISAASGLVLSVQQDTLTVDGTLIQQQTRQQTRVLDRPKTDPELLDVPWQSWDLVQIDPGVFKIVLAGGKVLDVQGASTENQAPIQLFSDNGEPNQRWVLQLVDADAMTGTGLAFVIISAHSGRVLDVPDASTVPGQTIQQYHWLYGPQKNQQWFLDTATIFITRPIEG